MAARLIAGIVLLAGVVIVVIVGLRDSDGNAEVVVAAPVEATESDTD